jgi:hypothetical protein
MPAEPRLDSGGGGTAEPPNPTESGQATAGPGFTVGGHAPNPTPALSTRAPVVRR